MLHVAAQIEGLGIQQALQQDSSKDGDLSLSLLHELVKIF